VNGPARKDIETSEETHFLGTARKENLKSASVIRTDENDCSGGTRVNQQG
jgi:hypothetical protein